MYLVYLFRDVESGEEFGVSLKYDSEQQPNAIKDLYPQARKIALENFEKVKFLGICDEEDMDILGIDIY